MKIIGLREHVARLKESVECAKKTGKESRSLKPVQRLTPLPTIRIDYMLSRHTEFKSMLTKHLVSAEKSYSDGAIVLRGQEKDVNTGKVVGRANRATCIPENL